MSKFKVGECYVMKGPLKRGDLLYAKVLEIGMRQMLVEYHYKDGHVVEDHINLNGTNPDSYTVVTEMTIDDAKEKLREAALKKAKAELKEIQSHINKLEKLSVKKIDTIKAIDYLVDEARGWTLFFDTNIEKKAK